ncbi:MAG: formylmethionine deformylase [Parcubacteria group bacterium Gr01-1014_38]|nr:MAG: formylmethionine deformylase [Parcubacteria group bacterium Gr01-1014_38]
MVRTIITVPDPLLREQSAPVEDPRAPEIQELITDLKESCLAAEGIGLAAPQLGVAKRVIVINHPQGKPYALVNPEIFWASSGTSALEEGCLSIPGIIVRVTRPKKVKIHALDERGEWREIAASDLLAKILQHEIDHLNGVLITDYAEGRPEHPETPQISPGALLKV